MLRLPRKMMYALEAVVDIAYNARPEPVQSKEIARRQGIPQRYLDHDSRSAIMAELGLDSRGIADAVSQLVAQLDGEYS